ncbi:Uncharacterised protein [Candidatus Tiddalikarchaeum anstoanum]|nr:Uncharacterised protein [Candidatus Tiddalikarchaeum anstoanum]
MVEFLPEQAVLIILLIIGIFVLIVLIAGLITNIDTIANLIKGFVEGIF